MKKIICSVIVIIMLLSAIPVCAAPAEAENDGSEAVTLEPIAVQKGLCVLLGEYSGIETGKFYFFYRKDGEENYSTAVANQTLSGGRYNVQIAVEPNADYEYFFALKKNDGDYVKGEHVTFHTLSYTSFGVNSTRFKTPSQRLEYIFGEAPDAVFSIDNPPLGYATAEEAEAHIKTITVPVWKLKGNKKISSEYELRVNAKLTGNVKKIFAELYDMGYPIIKLKSFSYRKIGGRCVGSKERITSEGILSMHSFGTAIDVNPEQNDLYYMEDARDTESPYYITEEIVALFAKYGWEWGGSWDTYVDTMHFQYIGNTNLE